MKKPIMSKIHGLDKYHLDYVDTDNSKKQQMYNKIMSKLTEPTENKMNRKNKSYTKKEDKQITEIYNKRKDEFQTQQQLCELIAEELNTKRTWKAIENRLWVLRLNRASQKPRQAVADKPKDVVIAQPIKTHDYNLYALYLIIAFLVLIIFMLVK